MKNLKSLYLYFSSLMFVIALIFSSSAFVDAGCFTCYSNNQNCPIAATCGMDQCDAQLMDHVISTARCVVQSVMFPEKVDFL